jgi:predicted exporter
MEGRVRIINKKVEIVKGSDGKPKVREILFVACDDHDEALRVESALKARLEGTIRAVEGAAKPSRLPLMEAP